MGQNIDKCRSCNAPIRWVRMPSGKANPLDAQPSEKGNVRIEENEIGKIVPKDEMIAGEPLYLSHFATCPNAAKYRRK